MSMLKASERDTGEARDTVEMSGDASETSASLFLNDSLWFLFLFVSISLDAETNASV